MALNRQGVADMVRDCLRADVATLYGSGKLVQAIVSDPVEFENARVDVGTYYKLFLVARDKSQADVRSQNEDSTFTVSYRIEGLNIDPATAQATIDQIDEQIGVLINAQMYSGLMFTSYYSDSKAKLWDAEYNSSALTVETRNGEVHAECEGAILISVNKEK